MTDRRLTPDPEKVTRNDPAQIVVPLADLMRRPGGPRDRQLLYGERVTILDVSSGWCYVQAAKDGYCGHVQASATYSPFTPTHRVTAPATNTYAEADLKSPDHGTLSFGAQVAVTETKAAFAKTASGFIPLQHLSPVDRYATDPAQIAGLFLGTPYLWGGNSRWGIDCSGLIQASCLACNIPCPGDSDLQEQTLGTLLPADTPFLRNDLLFWKGHVALTLDAENMIHANAFNMAVTVEPIATALVRIAKTDGPLAAHKRLILANGKRSSPNA